MSTYGDTTQRWRKKKYRKGWIREKEETLNDDFFGLVNNASQDGDLKTTEVRTPYQVIQEDKRRHKSRLTINLDLWIGLSPHIQECKIIEKKKTSSLWIVAQQKQKHNDQRQLEVTNVEIK